jgi:hypothetical protein
LPSANPEGQRLSAECRMAWPATRVEGWLETCATIHMWTQIVGKVKLARAPFTNHWWHIALYLTPRGLTTSVLPDPAAGAFQIDFDFLAHRLIIATSDRRYEEMQLTSLPLSEFYEDFVERLSSLGIEARIWPVPVEVVEATPFPEDHGHSDYRPEIAEELHRLLLLAKMTLAEFCEGFIGKCSPVHFFWGSFDLALTRFSGRKAPEHPGGVPNLADWVTREAYSHEVWSCGFWPGTACGFERPAFYSYAYPEPPGFAKAVVRPPASYITTLREFILPYDEVRSESDPGAAVRRFLKATYEAAADLGGWDRPALER